MSSSAVAVAPALPAASAVGVDPHLDPNKPLADLTEVMDQSRNGSGSAAEGSGREEAYVPLEMAELRVKSMMGDLANMKSDHLARFERLQKFYNDLVRNNHKLATDNLEKARALALERIKVYKDNAKALSDKMKVFERDAEENKKLVGRLTKLSNDRQAEIDAQAKERATLNARVREWERKYDEALKAGQSGGALAAEVDRLKAEHDKEVSE